MSWVSCALDQPDCCRSERSEKVKRFINKKLGTPYPRPPTSKTTPAVVSTHVQTFAEKLLNAGRWTGCSTR
ncbi:hypothetical protein ACLKA6_008674 [Drosophila palustris]